LRCEEGEDAVRVRRVAGVDMMEDVERGFGILGVSGEGVD